MDDTPQLGLPEIEDEWQDFDFEQDEHYINGVERREERRGVLPRDALTGTTAHDGKFYETGTAGSIMLHCPNCDPDIEGPFRFRQLPFYWLNRHNECCWTCNTELLPIEVPEKKD